MKWTMTPLAWRLLAVDLLAFFGFLTPMLFTLVFRLESPWSLLVGLFFGWQAGNMAYLSWQIAGYQQDIIDMDRAVYDR